MPSKPRIAVDAMGGDFGPQVVVKGAVAAAREQGISLLLVGDTASVEAELATLDVRGMDIEVQHASQVVDMDEKPSDALRRKKDSSITVACRLVKEGRADGVVSAGHSGATVASGIFVLGRIPGVERPALASVMPTEKKPVVFIDVGANVDSKPSHLLQFGIMADVLAKSVLSVGSPRVGLLTIGEEEGKGNAVVRAAFDLFKNSSLNFLGNVEGRDIFSGEVDVVVCDGFVGNVALKLAEGLSRSLGRMLKTELKGDLISKAGAMLAMRAFKRFAQLMDPNEYGGAPLLGLERIALVCHGKSTARGIQRAVEMGATFVRNKALDQLVVGLEANADLAATRRQARAPKQATA
jgi:glycerol-3-phosphate acyltransferase PlsX